MSRTALAVVLGMWAWVHGAARAEDKGGPNLPPETAPPPQATPAAGCGGCCNGDCAGEKVLKVSYRPCLRSLVQWLTYCPGPCKSCCGHRCAPCCDPHPYEFFLNHCPACFGANCHQPGCDGARGPTGPWPGGWPPAFAGRPSTQVYVSEQDRPPYRQ